jgi:hypothetical protein
MKECIQKKKSILDTLFSNRTKFQNLLILVFERNIQQSACIVPFIQFRSTTHCWLYIIAETGKWNCK